MAYFIIIISAVLIFLYVTWRVFYTIYNDNKYLDPLFLEDIATGRLKKYHRDYSDVKRHISVCKKCQARVNEIQFGKPLEDHLLES